MKSERRCVLLLRVVLLVLGTALLMPAVGAAATLHPKLLAKVGYGAVPPGFVRTGDGTLHAVFDQNKNWGDSYNGIAALSVSPSGHVGPAVQALNWNGQSAQGIPGLAVMPSGALEATWGGYPNGNDGPWGISSSDGGSSWSAPANIGSGSMEFGDSAVGIQVSNGTPVLTAGCCGGIVIQKGFGPGAPTYLLTNNSDGAAGNTDSAIDGATGADIASWDSNDGSGGLWLQQVAPSEGTAEKAPVPTQYGTGAPLILAGRDTGPGVFAAYPANFGNTTHMRLLRYGGGSIAVGSVKGLHTNTWGVATGSDGRVWVMWSGQLNGHGVMAFTRSNKAVTKFEPIQTYGFTWTSLFTLSGDGRLGPLDLLMSGAPAVPATAAGGIYYARIQPELSTKVSVKSLGHGKFAVKVKVTDAGDPVSGVIESVKGHHKRSNTGTDKVTVRGSSRNRVAVKVSVPGYTTVSKRVKL